MTIVKKPSKAARMSRHANLAEQFFKKLTPERRKLWGVEQAEQGKRGTTTLSISHPAGLVALSGFLKRLANKRANKRSEPSPVFCRGEVAWHETLVPSALRHVKSQNELDSIISVEDALEKEIKNRLGHRMKRFSERHFSAILQHYGVRTSWIDLVDNLFVAVWFALHERHTDENSQCYYKPSSRQTGWIHFIRQKIDSHPKLRIRDLRSEYHSLSLRPHAQHAITATRWTRQHWRLDNLDLSPYVVASVKIPNLPKLWKLQGHMWSQEFFFPTPKHDHTYSVLLRRETADILDAVAKEFGLPKQQLGKIDLYKHKT